MSIVNLASEEETECREHVAIKLGEGVLLLVEVEDGEGGRADVVLDVQGVGEALHEG